MVNITAQKKDTIFNILKQYVRNGHYTEALTHYQQNSSEEPHYLEQVGLAFEGLNKEDSAFYYYKFAREKYNKSGFAKKVAEINLEIAHLLVSQNNLDSDPIYFEEFWEYAIKSKDTALLAQGNNFRGNLSFNTGDPDTVLKHFQRAFRLFKGVGRNKDAITNLMNMGAVYSNRFNNHDSAVYYYQLALDILKSNDMEEDFSNLHHNLLNNMGNSYKLNKDYKKALFYFHRAETLDIKKYKTKTKKILYGNMDASYYYLNDFEKAYDYLYKYDSIKDIISLENQNASISEIQEKYDNEKLRANNLEIENKRIQNRNLLFAALGLLVIGVGIAVLLQKNTTKKRQLAEQDAILKQQRVENLLKEQELVSIDAMIAGQEKERQKVAGELHDDLGSLMATIKLHFDNAKISKKDPSLQSAQKLLEEAYQKVRGMAHSKNSGVMSDQGLIPAIKKMAKTITQTNALEVTVEDFGMGERMENSLELSIFRMVQELLANAIKHAEASIVAIQLTQHEDNLNIIVEDNGKGFDRSGLNATKTGMGLTTIEKRIEHLEGNFTIDSVLGKGTSILIDIPV